MIPVWTPLDCCLLYYTTKTPYCVCGEGGGGSGGILYSASVTITIERVYPLHVLVNQHGTPPLCGTLFATIIVVGALKLVVIYYIFSDFSVMTQWCSG